MKIEQSSIPFIIERKEETKLEVYRTAIRDARHIFNTYKAAHPDDAWECIRRIIFSDKLK